MWRCCPPPVAPRRGNWRVKATGPLEEKGNCFPWDSAVDRTLSGGVALGALHETSTNAPGAEPAMRAFALTLAALVAQAMRCP